MLTLAIASPAWFMLLIFLLARLEERIVLPVARAERISRMLEDAPPDEVEGLIAQMLAPVAPRRQAS